MSSNKDADREDLIRKSAHQIWESEGRPHGHSDRHWKQATILAESEQDAENIALKRSIDPSEATGPHEPAQPDQT
ncbi:MAG: DUF2934 domain-containing protein [Sphingobacteriales bacterium]|nr:MAG: DUF2934 domain-containing protein [Sphingobacteriales bacterium]